MSTVRNNHPSGRNHIPQRIHSQTSVVMVPRLVYSAQKLRFHRPDGTTADYAGWSGSQRGRFFGSLVPFKIDLNRLYCLERLRGEVVALTQSAPEAIAGRPGNDRRSPCDEAFP